MRITEQQQMNINEVSRLERLVEQRASKLEKLKKAISLRRPARYGVSFDFAPGDLTPQTKSFSIKPDVVFRPSTLEDSVVVTYTSGFGANELLQTTVVVDNFLFSDTKTRTFSYLWQITDSTTNRQWQNLPQPSAFLLSYFAPLYLQNRPVIPGNTKISITITPQSSSLGLTPTAVKVTLNFFMDGYEVLK